MAHIFQIIAREIPRERRGSLRLVILTSGSDGPSLEAPGTFVDSWDSAEAMVAIGAVGGLVRTARIEMPELSILSLDTDELGGSRGSMGEACRQILREVGGSDGHMEVAYRNRCRWVPKLEETKRLGVTSGVVGGGGRGGK